jgi:hypothetical protein
MPTKKSRNDDNAAKSRRVNFQVPQLDLQLAGRYLNFELISSLKVLTADLDYIYIYKLLFFIFEILKTKKEYNIIGFTNSYCVTSDACIFQLE